ncbi:hypothetical protein D9V30_10290 [Mycetocola reblochoni]|uniref:Uncharacterized protein n=1 Tax=Mycetocola reblochoni TaxID=331618 RepID=A0A3L6ZK53_9MICO|nr:hypothetical protein [Mycetocola reblochoni]RLP68369.1 hypothetical protein D9V30_10290 [Mycetocola reblochoni]
MTDYKKLIDQLRAVEPTWPRGMYGCPRDMYSDVKPLMNEAANALEAATEPRIVRTAEQLRALPVGSVVLDVWGVAWQSHVLEPLGVRWRDANSKSSEVHARLLVSRCSLIVLHAPEVTR